MFDQLMQLIREHALSSVINNNDVPNEHNDAVMNEAGQTIVSELKNAIQGGNASQVKEMIAGQSNQLSDAISGNFASNIANKFGINPASAQHIAGSLIPQVLASFGKKVEAAGSGLDLKNVTELFSGEGGKNMMSEIGSKIGLDKDGDGDVDLGDVKKLFGA
jgi:hypothetical protein